MVGPVYTSTGAASRAQALLSNGSLSKRRQAASARSMQSSALCSLCASVFALRFRVCLCVRGVTLARFGFGGFGPRVRCPRWHTKPTKRKANSFPQACCEFWKVSGAFKCPADCFEIVYGPQEHGVRSHFCKVHAWSCKRFAGAGMLGLFEILV